MNECTKRAIKMIPIIFLCLSALLLIVAFLIKDVPAEKSYVYSNNQIITTSWHNFFVYFTEGLFIAILISAVILTIICVVAKVKSKEKITRKISLIWISGIVCSVIIMLSNILVLNIWSDDDYSPQCYKFTDGQHTIVIEEKSFLLYGGATVYQIKDNNEAVILNEFSTDDGGRNNGHYDINWHDNYAEITYNTFNTKDSKSTKTIQFLS
ncbi:MAG: hypothetical protein ACI4JY_03265 [Oscillospiraceae bacterium]